MQSMKNLTSPLILLLGSGELGKEFIISAQRLGLRTVAVDKYPDAPAMQVADQFEVIDMLDGAQIKKIVLKYKPDFIVPEIEAIRTEMLLELESQGWNIIPSANAAYVTMNRDAIRNLAAQKLKLKTAKFLYAESLEDFTKASLEIGFPNVVKPVMSSSGKGQSVVKSKNDIKKAWDYAVQGMRGDKQKVIVEEFIKFESEITLLTVKQRKGPTLFVNPIGHRQERGDYQESWMPAKMSAQQLLKAKKMAKKITDELGGAGLFGVEFFLTKNEVYFSELSPRPHDTGLVTLISQNLSEFDLHLRAILGLPISKIQYYGPSASAAILAKQKMIGYHLQGIEKAIKQPETEVRIFGKVEARPFRRMGVVLARGKNIASAKKNAIHAKNLILIKK